MKMSPPKLSKRIQRKDQGQPCVQGEAASRSGCIPASNDHKKPQGSVQTPKIENEDTGESTQHTNVSEIHKRITSAKQTVLDTPDGNESAIVTDSMGVELGRMLGDDGSVKLPVANQCKDPKANLLHFHNHPGDIPPSEGDWIAWVENPGIKTAYVMNKGKEYRIELQPKAYENSGDFLKDVSHFYGEEYRKVMKEISKGTREEPAASLRYSRLVTQAYLLAMRRLSDNGWMEYHVEEVEQNKSLRGTKDQGQPCKQGETTRSGCIPASGKPSSATSPSKEDQTPDAGARTAATGRSQPQGESTPPPAQAAPTKLSDEQRKERRLDYMKKGIRSKPFKEFFGDWENDPANASKVVDKKTGEPAETRPGELRQEGPKLVFHGTPHGKFDAYSEEMLKDPENLVYGPGFYFTDNVEEAEHYTNPVAHESRYGEGSVKNPQPYVLSAYLNVRKPFDIDKDTVKGTDLPEDQRKILRSAVLQYTMANLGPAEARETAKEFDRGELSYSYRELARSFGLSRVKLNARLKELGYDGLTLMSTDRGFGGQHWIVFDTNQAKAVDNVGDFEPGAGFGKALGHDGWLSKSWALSFDKELDALDKSLGIGQTKSLPTSKMTHPDQWIDNERDIIAGLGAMGKDEAVAWAAMQGITWAKTKPAVLREVQKMIDRLARSRQQTSF